MKRLFSIQKAYRSQGFGRLMLVFGALALISLVTGSCVSTSFQEPLITQAQFETPYTDDDLILRRGPEQGAPLIVVNYPTNGATVRTPFQVKLRFVPQDNASIDLDSLLIKYKIFNLTKKVAERMKVTSSGIEGEIDGLSPGEYKLNLSISDDRSRTGQADLKFIVAR